MGRLRGKRGQWNAGEPIGGGDGLPGGQSVVDEAGLPVAGATVIARRGRRSRFLWMSDSSKTDDKGEFSLPGVPPDIAVDLLAVKIADER